MSRGLAEPLLQPSSPTASGAPPYRRFLCLAAAGALCLYVFLGVLERVTFVRMATAMPAGVMLMHTLIAVMSLMLFSVLQLARSQSTAEPISNALLQLHIPDVVSMAVLDVIRSISALLGATVTPGITQALLLQCAVPAATLFGALLPPVSAVAGVHAASGSSNPIATLYAQMMHTINHSSPAQCLVMVICSPRTYQAVGAVAIACIVAAVLLLSEEASMPSAAPSAASPEAPSQMQSSAVAQQQLVGLLPQQSPLATAHLAASALRAAAIASGLASQPSALQLGASQPGASQPGASQPGASQPGASQPGASQPGASQPGASQPGALQPGASQPSASQPPSGAA
jgi:hypothetical protein